MTQSSANSWRSKNASFLGETPKILKFVCWSFSQTKPLFVISTIRTFRSGKTIKGRQSFSTTWDCTTVSSLLANPRVRGIVRTISSMRILGVSKIFICATRNIALSLQKNIVITVFQKINTCSCSAMARKVLPKEKSSVSPIFRMKKKSCWSVTSPFLYSTSIIAL